MAGGTARGTGLEDVSIRSGAAGDDPEAERRRRACARHSDHTRSGGSDGRQARAGTNLRGGLRGQSSPWSIASVTATGLAGLAVYVGALFYVADPALPNGEMVKWEKTAERVYVKYHGEVPLYFFE